MAPCSLSRRYSFFNMDGMGITGFWYLDGPMNSCLPVQLMANVAWSKNPVPHPVDEPSYRGNRTVPQRLKYRLAATLGSPVKHEFSPDWTIGGRALLAVERQLSLPSSKFVLDKQTTSVSPSNLIFIMEIDNYP